MAKLKYDDDLFKDSTMTFGEHLEELRVCLFKSVLGLAVGFAVGLFIGGSVVEFFRAPLERALDENARQIALAKRAAELATMPQGTRIAPEDDPVTKLINQGELVYTPSFINPRELLGELDQKYPGVLNHEAMPAASAPLTKSDLLPLKIYTLLVDDWRSKVTTMNATEAFMIYIKASLAAGLVLAAPWIFYQIWQFIAAGLYPHERSYVYQYLPFSLGLFLAGASLAYVFVFDPVLNFLFAFNRWLGLGTDMRISEWLSFVILMPLGFGVSFQLPLVMLFAERIGVVTVDMYISKWRIAVLGIFILAMVLTPSGDPQSMLLMAAPLTVLYGGGILLCKYMPRRPSAYEEFAESAH